MCVRVCVGAVVRAYVRACVGGVTVGMMYFVHLGRSCQHLGRVDVVHEEGRLMGFGVLPGEGAGVFGKRVGCESFSWKVDVTSRPLGHC